MTAIKSVSQRAKLKFYQSVSRTIDLSLPYHGNTHTYIGRVNETFGYDLPHLVGREVLDIGCSRGLTTRELSKIYPNARITGIDIDHEFIRESRKRYTAEIEQGVIDFVTADGYFPGDVFEREQFGLVFMMNNFCFTAHNMGDSTLRSILGNVAEVVSDQGHILVAHTNTGGLVNYVIFKINRASGRCTLTEHRREINNIHTEESFRVIQEAARMVA